MKYSRVNYISNTRLADLSEAVNKHMEDGWEPIGPLVVDPGTDGEAALYTQMIGEPEHEPK